MLDFPLLRVGSYSVVSCSEEHHDSKTGWQFSVASSCVLGADWHNYDTTTPNHCFFPRGNVLSSEMLRVWVEQLIPPGRDCSEHRERKEISLDL